MSPLSFLHELYRCDAAYFQRLLDFFLQSRFHTVRLWVNQKHREPVFLSTEGEVVHCVDRSRRWKTLTEWYNDTTDSRYAAGDPAVFEHIHITRRVNIGNILKTIAHKEVDEFVDMKYRSSQVYHWILRRLKARQMTYTATQVFQIQWEDRVYEVEKNKTTTDDGYSVAPFLKYMCDETHPTGVLWRDTNGPWILLTEDLPLPKSSSEVFSEPSDITQDFTHFSVESELQELKDRFQEYVESEKQARDELLEELSCVRSELSNAQSELSVLRSETQDLRAYNQEILQSFQGLQAFVYQNYQILQGVQSATNQQEQVIQGLQSLANQQQFTIQNCSECRCDEHCDPCPAL